MFEVSRQRGIFTLVWTIGLMINLSSPYLADDRLVTVCITS
jgi:hypothetical protein